VFGSRLGDVGYRSNKANYAPYLQGASPACMHARPLLACRTCMQALCVRAHVSIFPVCAVQGDVDPEGKTYRAPVPKSLTKKFVGGREMYVPKYDHKKAGGDGWGWLW
jgi:hypothetical protein